MLLDRHRIAKLIELADLERRLTGAERQQREEDVALLIKAAYDDASDAARAAFMARVQPMPVTAWPWSAVQVDATRSRSGVAAGGVAAGGVAAGSVARAVTGRAITGLSATPTAAVPPLLLLIRGEAESADVDRGNRLPDRGAPEAATWEPLYRALDRWDTLAIAGWIGPQGWVSPSGAVTGPPTEEGGKSTGATGSSPGEGGALGRPASASSLTWRSPAVIAAGATVASTLGVVLFSVRRRGAGLAPQQETP
jgi:hypothetical protein